MKGDRNVMADRNGNRGGPDGAIARTDPLADATGSVAEGRWEGKALMEMSLGELKRLLEKEWFKAEYAKTLA